MAAEKLLAETLLAETLQAEVDAYIARHAQARPLPTRSLVSGLDRRFLGSCRMRENDGRKLDHRTLEQMRLRAVDAVESGVHPEDVAASFGVGRGTVYGWLAKYREGGREALKARPVPGRTPKLSGQRMRRLYTLITGTDPRQLEFEFALWTREMVRALIRREFAVSLSAVSVGRLLRGLGLSPQRPLWRAWQADPEAVRRWKDTERLSFGTRRMSQIGPTPAPSGRVWSVTEPCRSYA